MANFQPLVQSAGLTEQMPLTDSLIVGTGILTTSSDLTITPGTVNINIPAAKGIQVSGAGTSFLDFSLGTGITKTTTGAVTIGGASGTCLVSSTSTTVTNALFANGGVDRSAAATLSLGTANANAIAIGNGTITTTITGFASNAGAGAGSERWGAAAVAAGTNATALGNTSAANGNTSVAVGQGASTAVAATASVVIGQGAAASVATAQVAIGQGAAASALNGVAIGQAANTSANNCVSVGQAATCTAASAVALGGAASATALGCISIGTNTINANGASMVFGVSATSTATSQIVFGSTTAPVTDGYFGRGVTAAAPATFRVRATGGNAGAVVGADLEICGGLGGSAATAGGAVRVRTATSAAGTTLNDRILVTPDGLTAIGGISGTMTGGTPQDTLSIKAVSPATFTGAEFNLTTKYIQTIAAAAGTITCFTLNVSSAYWVWCDVVVRATNATGSAYFKIGTRVFREGGGATLGTAQSTLVSEPGGLAASINATFAVSGNDLTLVCNPDVPGAETRTLNWVLTMRYQRVSGNT